MATDSEQSRNENSAEFSDEAIRRFLLGRLSASEQPRFERRLFEDDGLDSRVRLAELNLADDYAYLRLTAGERELFEEKFLLSADRRRKAEVSLALRNRFASASVVEPKPTFVAGIRSLLLFRRSAWRYMVAVVILLLLAGSAWVVVKKEKRIKEEIAKPWIRRRSPTPAVPLESDHPTNNALPEPQTSPSPMPVHDQTPPPLVSIRIVLKPSGPSGTPDIASVPLPGKDQRSERFELPLNSNQAGTYWAELLTSDGQLVFSANAIKVPENGTAQIDLDVPARLLEIGNYQVKVSRDHARTKENVGRYYFRVK